MPRLSCSSLLLALTSVSCTVDAPLGADMPATYRVVVDTPAELKNELDLLFVIDNSKNMAARQEQLAENFQNLLYRLNFGRGMPDVHVGVVSTDMGIAEFGGLVPECTSTGDGGTLSAAALDCGLTDTFMAMQADVDGGVLGNFRGAATDVFACMTQLGENGCEYEQPLEAMRRSLDSSIINKVGFIRPNAVLGVVILTDEDDCSAYNPEIFNPDSPFFRDDEPNFRCFQSGVICEGDDVYKPGVRDGCHPRAESDYIANVDQYVDFMKELKPDPRDRVLSAMIGDPGHVNIEVDMDGLDAQLTASCQDSMGTAVYPGVRLSAFVESFAGQGSQTSLCTGAPQHALDGMVTKLRQSMGTTCLQGEVADVDENRAGRQVDCRVYEQLGQDEALRTSLTECDNPGNLADSSVVPCYSILTGGEACGDFRTQLALQVHGRTILPHRSSRLIAECRVNEQDAIE